MKELLDLDDVEAMMKGVDHLQKLLEEIIARGLLSEEALKKAAQDKKESKQ